MVEGQAGGGSSLGQADGLMAVAPIGKISANDIERYPDTRK